MRSVSEFNWQGSVGFYKVRGGSHVGQNFVSEDASEMRRVTRYLVSWSLGSGRTEPYIHVARPGGKRPKSFDDR